MGARRGGSPRPARSLLYRALPQILVFVVVAAVYLLGGFEPVERTLMDLRFRLAERPASGGLVVVGIDSQSLKELATWPWPRAYHAAVIDRLLAAGARKIEFDVDLSAASTPGDDSLMEAALVRAHSRVILPAFAQRVTRAGAAGVSYTFPASRFAAHAALGAVNVFPGPDGLVREAPTGVLLRGTVVPSAAALLLGGAPPVAGNFYIDFGIRERSIPTLSYVDVLKGRFDPAAVAGKDVIVGATAVELGDQFAVPLHRSMAGPVLQALAYESMVEGRAIRRTGAIPTLLLTALLVFLGGRFLARPPWQRGLAFLIGASAMMFLAALALQALAPVSVDIGPPLAGALLLYAVAVLRELERQAYEALKHRMSDLHRRAMMQCVMEDSFDGIIIADEGGRIVIANPAAARLLEYDADGMVGEPIDRFLPGSAVRLTTLPGQWQGEDDCALDLGTPVEMVLRRADGSVLTVEHMIGCSRLRVSLHRKEQRVAGRTVFVHTFRDVSERKKAEDALRRAMQDAQCANRAKTEFLANMSHELRTPLNAIIGFSEVIDSQIFGSLPPRYRDYTGDIVSSGKHLLGIINDILDVSKIEAGEITLTEEALDLEDILATSIKLVRGRSSAQTLKLRCDVSGTVRVIGDARLIKQIVLNLLSNAVKFTPPGGSVTASAEIEAGRAIVRVSDTGIGIPAEEIGKVTQPFYQVDSGMARKHEGTGLGLALARAYAGVHGADLTIASTVGRGTEVTLWFPAERTVTRIALDMSRISV